MRFVTGDELLHENKKIKIDGVPITKYLYDEIENRISHSNLNNIKQTLIEVLDNEINRLVNFDDIIKKETTWYLPVYSLPIDRFYERSLLRVYEYKVETKPVVYAVLYKTDPRSIKLSNISYLFGNSRMFNKIILESVSNSSYIYNYYNLSDKEFGEFLSTFVKKIGNETIGIYRNIIANENDPEALLEISNEILEFSKNFVHTDVGELKRGNINFVNKALEKIAYLMNI